MEVDVPRDTSTRERKANLSGQVRDNPALPFRIAWERKRGLPEMCRSETITVRLAQQGDAAAFEYLYRLYSRHVYAICSRMVGNKKEAEDLTQEIFLQSFRDIQSFRGRSAFSKALRRLTINLARMRRLARNSFSKSDELVSDLVSYLYLT
jgi:Sigma-70 region 2